MLFFSDNDICSLGKDANWALVPFGSLIHVCQYFLCDCDLGNGLSTLLIRSNSLCRNGRAGTMHDAQMSFPANDSSSERCMFLCDRACFTSALYSGNLIMCGKFRKPVQYV